MSDNVLVKALRGISDRTKQTGDEAQELYNSSYLDRLDYDGKNNDLAATEHRNFSRAYINENPLLGPAAMLAAVPAYDIAKWVGALGEGSPNRSDPSINSMAEGYRGIGDGLSDIAYNLTGKRFLE